VTLKTFNYADYKQQWLTRCKELSIDPAVGPLAGNQYQIVLIKAEARIERKRRQAGWWEPEIHGRARTDGDVTDAQSTTWNLEPEPERLGNPDDWRDSDFDLTFDELWRDAMHEIRKEVSPRNYERWQSAANETGRSLKPDKLKADLVPVV
jgi:hypothetical protein